LPWRAPFYRHYGAPYTTGCYYYRIHYLLAKHAEPQHAATSTLGALRLALPLFTTLFCCCLGLRPATHISRTATPTTRSPLATGRCCLANAGTARAYLTPPRDDTNNCSNRDGLHDGAVGRRRRAVGDR